MLDDYAVHGAVLRRYSRAWASWPRSGADVVARFQAWLRTAGCAVSTVRTYGDGGRGVRRVHRHPRRAGWLDAGVVEAFVATLAGYQFKTVEQKLCAVRSFLRFAGGDGLVDAAVLEAVPAAKSTQAGQDPVGMGPGRGDQDPGGGRPGQPVRETRLRDHPADHQARAARHRRQTAGVRRLRLAGQPAVGGAGQDRPPGAAAAAEGRRLGGHRLHPVTAGRSCDCPQVFLRHTAPIGPFSDQDHLHQILVKHARAAHVPVSEKRRHGMHSLRHSLATRLLEDGTPVEQIADILGHQSVASTGVYLKSSLGLLAKCALDPDAPGDAEASTMSRRHHAGRRDHGAGRREACRRLQVRRRGAGAGPVRGVLPPRVPRAGHAHRGLGRGVDRRRPAAGGHDRRPCRAWPRRSGSWPAGWAAGACRPTSCPPGALPRPARYVPHIYTDQELAALFAQTDRCHYCSQVPFRHLVMPVLFRTIYACGLRAREARLLRVGDVDLDAGVLQIRDAKGGKDRQVPVCEPLRDRLAGYHAQVAGRPDAGLVLPRHQAGPAADARQHRQELPPVPLAGAHLPRRAGPRPPRSRSAAHLRGQQPAVLVRPAARTSARCCRSCRPTWAIRRIADTAYYLRLTAESYPDITARVQQAIGDVVPPVTAGPLSWRLTSRCSCAAS